MVKRKDRTARRQILQLKEEKSRPYLQPGNNIPGVPVEPSGENDDGAGVDEVSKSEPGSKNGVQRDAIDDQLEDFMKEIDAISTSVPETDIQTGEEKNELQNEEASTAASEPVPASEVSVHEVNSKETCPPGNVNAPAAVEGEAPACPWVECMDEATGYTYFWHQLTNEVTWDCPPEYEAYWAQYGEPLGTEVHNDASVTHVTAPDTTSATLVPAVASSGATLSSTVAVSSGQVSSSNTMATSVHTAEDEKSKPDALGQNSTTTVIARKKRKRVPAIGAVIPITSYGASDSSSSEDSDHERYAVQREQLKKHASKRSKLAAKQPQRESPSPVVYGPQLPDSLPCREEKPVCGPCLPDAPDSARMTVYGPHLPEEKMDVYGLHLPGSGDLFIEPVAIGPQLPQFYETASEKANIDVFIGPQLPENFYEEQAKLHDEQKPAVHGLWAGSEAPGFSQTCMEEDKPGVPFEDSTVLESKTGEQAVHESEGSYPDAKETCIVSGGAESSLAGLVDYPGSPVADSEAEEIGEDDKPVSMTSACTDPAKISIDYPVMTDGKLQFGNVAKVVHSKEPLLERDVQSSSSLRIAPLSPLGFPAMPRLVKSKRHMETKKKSQHLVSYGDSDSSDDDGEAVDVTALGSPAAPAPVVAKTEETEEEERHVGLGCPKGSAAEVLDTEGKKSSVKKPFVKVNFVRSDEVLVLSKCTDMGQEVAAEKMETEDAEKDLSPSSGRTAATEKCVTSPECKLPADSDVDDFDDVVRALDIALLESQKKAAQEGVAKHEALLQGENKESPCETSEEEGEIKSSEASSEAGMTPVRSRESDTEEELEQVKISAGLKKNAPSSRKAISPEPDKSAIILEIHDAYKLLMDQLNPIRDVIACRNSYFELVVTTMTRMEDWNAGALDANYFLQKLHGACAAATELQVLAFKARDTEADEPCQEPLPPGWQRHWDRSRRSVVFLAWAGRWAGEVLHCCPAAVSLFPFPSCVLEKPFLVFRF